jgi:hypothetical protein
MGASWFPPVGRALQIYQRLNGKLSTCGARELGPGLPVSHAWSLLGPRLGIGDARAYPGSEVATALSVVVDRVWRSDGPQGTAISDCGEGGICASASAKWGTPINDFTAIGAATHASPEMQVPTALRSPRRAGHCFPRRDSWTPKSCGPDRARNVESDEEIQHDDHSQDREGRWRLYEVWTEIKVWQDHTYLQEGEVGLESLITHPYPDDPFQ